VLKVVPRKEKQMMKMKAVVMALCVAGCGSAYLQAAGKFAATTSENVTALQGVTGLRGALCHKNAQFEYAYHRMDGVVMLPGEREPVTLLDYETRFPYNSTTWSKLCKEANDSDAVVQKTLLLIGAYAEAMKSITGADYSGKDVKSLITSVAALAQGLGGSKASGLAKSLVDPGTSIVGAIEQRYAKNRLADIVANANSGVTAMLAGIDGYLGAVRDESKLVRQSLDKVLLRADKLLPPANTVEYVDLAMRWVNDLDAIDAAITASREALSKLSDAETKLRAAAGRDDAPELKVLLGDLVTVLGDIEAVREALNQKGGK
jgi:hypothetical protein